MSASDWGKEFPSFAKFFNGRFSLKSGYIWSTEMTSKFSTFPWEAWRLKPGTHSQLSQHSFDNNHYSAYYREIWKPRREAKKSHVPREKMLLTKQLIVQNRQSQSVLVKKKKKEKKKCHFWIDIASSCWRNVSKSTAWNVCFQQVRSVRIWLFDSTLIISAGVSASG